MKIIKHSISDYIEPTRKNCSIHFYGDGANGGSARTTTARAMIFQHIRLFSLEWETRCTADFRLQRGVKEHKQQNDTNTMVGSKYFCSSQITTCAFIHFMHISRDVRRFGRIAYPMHVLWVFRIFFLLSSAAPIFVMYNYIIEWMSVTSRHGTTTVPTHVKNENGNSKIM